MVTDPAAHTEREAVALLLQLCTESRVTKPAEMAAPDIWASPLLATTAAAAAAATAQPPFGTPSFNLLDLDNLLELDLLELGASLATPGLLTPAQLAVKREAPALAPLMPAARQRLERLEPRHTAIAKRQPQPKQEPAQPGPPRSRLHRTAAVKSQLNLSDFPLDCEVQCGSLVVRCPSLLSSCTMG